jgi:hypothetical protein
MLPQTARGFIGVAFRIKMQTIQNLKASTFRPPQMVGRMIQLRTEIIQFNILSFPDYDFDRLRKEAAGLYESYADMGLK